MMTPHHKAILKFARQRYRTPEYEDATDEDVLRWIAEDALDAAREVSR